MKTTMLGLLAETPIHPGTGRGVGVWTCLWPERRPPTTR